MKIIYNVNPDVDGNGKQEHGVTMKMSLDEFFELQDLATATAVPVKALAFIVQAQIENAWDVIAAGQRTMMQFEADEDEEN